MNHGKKVLAVLCGAAMLPGIAACSSSNSSDVELEFMTGMSTGSQQLEALTSVVEDFEAQNPDVKVTLVPGTNSYESDIKVRLAGHNAPNLWNTHGWSRDRYSNFLEPLQDRSWAERMNGTLDNAIRKDDGSFYALPLDAAITGIVYNKTVLDAAGVDANDINSWDDFSAACEKVVATGATCVAASGKETWTGGDIVDYMAPGLYSEEQLEELQNGTFDSDQWAKAVTPVYEWARAGYLNVDYTSATSDDVARLIASDQCAFGFQPNSLAQSVETYNPDAELGFMAYPSEDGSRYLISAEDYAFGVSNASEHKEEALRLLDFLAEPDNMKKLSDTTSNPPAFDDVEMNIGQLSTSYDYWVTEQQTRTVPVFDRVYLPNGMWDTLTSTTDALITGQDTPDEAAQQMKTSFDSLYGQES